MSDNLTLLICDDEKLSRKGICYYISQLEGFEVVSEASNGVEAIEKIQKYLPDIMIIDMKMPHMNGVEVLERLQAIGYEKTKVLVLSAFDEFEFAQQAMHFGACDYLLKPTNIHLLEKVLTKIKMKILREKDIKQKVEDHSQLVEYSNLILLSDFYKSIITGSMDKTDIETKRIFFKLPNGSYQIVLLSPDRLFFIKKNSSLFTENILYYIHDFMGNTNIEAWGTFVTSLSIFVLVTPQLCEKNSTIALAKNLQHFVGEKLSSTVSVAIGKPCNLNNLNDSFEKTKSILQQRFFLGEKLLLSEKKEVKVDNLIIPEDFEETILNSVRYKDEKLGIHVINNIFVTTEHRHIKREEWLKFCYNISFEIRSMLDNYSIESGNEELANDIMEIANLSTKYDMREWLIQLIKESIIRIHDVPSGQPLIIRKALSYIGDHYKENISLQDVANYVSLSLNYFSNLFKQTTGQTVLECISRRRIQEAKRLLKTTNQNISEIAFLLGYDSPRYFSEVFSRYEGKTPSNYRKSL